MVSASQWHWRLAALTLLLATGVSASLAGTPQARGAAGTGKVTVSDITVTKKIDKSSTSLFLADAPAKHPNKITVSGPPAPYHSP